MSIIGGFTDPIAAKIKNPFSTTVKNNGERGPDFPNGFEIIEYVNGVPQQAQSVRLLGNMMPFQPFEWSGEQRLVKEYYPGNPEAQVQVLGAKEGPVNVKGRFKARHYKDPAYYAIAYEYSKAIDEIRKRGNLVRAGMFGNGVEWVRYGFIEKANFKMNKITWIDYEIDFLVVSESQPKNNFFAAREKNSPVSINQNLINSAADFNQKYSTVPATMPQSISDVLNSGINAVAKEISSVTNFVGTILSTVQSIENSASRALGLIKNARSSISSFSRQIDAITHSFGSHSSGRTAKGIVKTTFQNIGYIADVSVGLSAMTSYLSKMQSQFESIARSVPKARHRVQGADTLQNISVKHYGSPQHWDKIYDHNSLTSTALKPGRVLEIPHL